MIRFWAHGVMWIAKRLINLRYIATGMQHLHEHKKFIIASQHQSFWDTIIFHCLVPEPIYIVKRELLRIPLYNVALKKLGVIDVDRKVGLSALRGLIQRAKQIIEQKDTIVIFPEGSRMAPGEVGEIKVGVVALYKHLNLPIVPVTLNSGQFWSRRSFMKLAGTIDLQFHPPILPGLDKDQIKQELHKIYSKKYIALAIGRVIN